MISKDNIYVDFENSMEQFCNYYMLHKEDISKNSWSKLYNILDRALYYITFFVCSPIAFIINMFLNYSQSKAKEEINNFFTLVGSFVITAIIYLIIYIFDKESFNQLSLCIGKILLIVLSCKIILEVIDVLLEKHLFKKSFMSIVNKFKNKEIRDFLLNLNKNNLENFINLFWNYRKTVASSSPFFKRLGILYFYDFYLYREKEINHIIINLSDMDLYYNRFNNNDIISFFKKDNELHVFINIEIKNFKNIENVLTEVKELFCHYKNFEAKNKTFENELMKIFNQEKRAEELSQQLTLIEKNEVKKKRVKI